MIAAFPFLFLHLGGELLDLAGEVDSGEFFEREKEDQEAVTKFTSSDWWADMAGKYGGGENGGVGPTGES